MMKTFKTKAGTELPLLDLRGKDYLVVAYRLVWFREEHSDWTIKASVEVDWEKQRCIGRAEIADTTGRLIASAHKVEDAKGFGDYVEKAETGAIGRALAMCGYGTQFAPELDEADRIVDSPVTRVAPQQPEPGDGVINHPNQGYLIPFGKYAQRSIEEIDTKALANYVIYIENKAHKDGRPLAGQVLDFVKRASAYLGALENEPLEAQSP